MPRKKRPTPQELARRLNAMNEALRKREERYRAFVASIRGFHAAQKAEADGLLPKPKVSGDIAERIIKNNGESIGGGEWEPGKSFWHELHDIFEAIATEYNGHLFESKSPSPDGNGADYFAPARAWRHYRSPSRGCY